MKTPGKILERLLGKARGATKKGRWQAVWDQWPEAREMGGQGSGPIPDPRVLEKKLQYRFSDPRLLITAMCHSSFYGEHQDRGPQPYERLEYLGDAVLGLAMGHLLMELFPDEPEGHLSRVRSSLVSEPRLAFLARDLDIGPHLILGRGEDMSGGRDKDRILADSVEAILGAIYLDGGFDPARDTVSRLFEEVMPTEADSPPKEDYKTRLQELVQVRFRDVPRYDLEGEEGPDHEKLFETRVRLPDGSSALGRGKSKKAAEQDAARAALHLIKQKPS